MAKQTNVNIDCTTYYASQAFFSLKELLKAHGWTVVNSGTGSAGSYFSTSDGITTAALMDGSRAWYVIRDPASKFWLCVQRTTSNNVFRVKIAVSAFSGGAPDREVVPSSTTETTLIGSGTDGSPTGANPFTGGAMAPRAHIITYDNDQNAGGIRSFYLLMTQGTSTLLGGFCFEALANGSYPTSMTEPFAVGWSTGNTFLTLSSGWTWWYKPGTVWASSTPLAQPYNNAAYIAGSQVPGVDPWNSDDLGIPTCLGRASTQSQPGFVGFLANIRLRGVARSYPDTATAAGVTSVYAGDCLVPYADGVTPL